LERMLLNTLSLSTRRLLRNTLRRPSSSPCLFSVLVMFLYHGVGGWKGGVNRVFTLFVHSSIFAVHKSPRFPEPSMRF
jgi:hypothetical protein